MYLDAENTMEAPNFKVDLSLPRLQSLLQNSHWDKEHVNELFYALGERFKLQKETVDFDAWMAKILYALEMHKIDPNLSLGNDQKVIQLVKDTNIGDDELLEKLKENRDIDLEEILQDLSQQEEVDRELIEKVRKIVTSVQPAIKKNDILCLNEEMEHTLYKMCKVIQDHFGKKPSNQTGMRSSNPWMLRTTQMVSWCLLALSKSSYLLQVRTGEGKSCIVAMFAAYRALKGEKVDIISSSPVLAERDAEEWKSFYEALGLRVGCNTNLSNDDDLKICYKCHIVYGTTDSFAGDWLQHHFLRKEIRLDRKFQCVIVDEVDSLMLDKGLEMVYLSSQMPAMLSLNTILSRIWCLVSQHQKFECGKMAGPIKSFFHILQEYTDITVSVIHDILKMAENKGLFPKGFTEDMKDLNAQNAIQKLECVDKMQVVDFFRLAEEKLPNYFFSLFSEEKAGSVKELNRTEEAEMKDRHEIPILILQGGQCRRLFPDMETQLNWVEQKIRKNIQFTCPEVTADNSHITGFQPLVYGKLRVWVENAFKAKEMALGDEYIIQADMVVPVDYKCTGIVQSNMKWSDGLQQFLEMKHQTKVSHMTVITNFMSNVRLFMMYGNQVFGVTGTLGNKDEIEMLKKLYKDMCTCTMPSFKRRKLFEEEGKIVMEEDEWLKAICSIVSEKVTNTSYRGERAVLVICETINRAETIEKAIKESVCGVNLKTYTKNNSGPCEVTKKPVLSRDVIVATNLAGRGTDLKVCEEVNKAGGLFVLQTFLPLNTRVEQQAFGRTGRQGNPGSAQLIMCANHFSGSVIVEIVKNMSLPPILLRQICTSLFEKETVQSLMIKALIPVLNDNQPRPKVNAALDLLLSCLRSLRETDITDAKHARDNVVRKRLSSYLEKDIKKIIKKEELFSDYLKLLKDMREKNKNTQMLSVITESMHECWGLWLQTSFDENESIQTLRERFNEAMGSARQILGKGRSPSSAVSFYVRYGNTLRLQKRFTDSIEMYTMALQANDQDFIALYNHALSVMQNEEKGYVNVALKDLEKAAKSVEHSIALTEETMENVVTSNPLPGHITSFTKQLCIHIQVLKCLKTNINEAVNKLKMAHNNGRGVRITERHVFFLVDTLFLFQHLKDVLYELGNLQSLGLTQIFSLETTFSVTGFFSRFFEKV